MNGADWFKGIGIPKNTGPKLYCVSGHVKKPGVYEFPMTITGKIRRVELRTAAGRRWGGRSMTTSRDRRSILLVVAIIVAGVSLTMSDRSGLPLALMPHAMPAAR